MIKINRDNLINYFMNRGWWQIGSGDYRCIRLESSNGNTIQIPKCDNFVEYNDIVDTAIAIGSVVENVSTTSIIEEITNTTDIIRFLEDARTQNFFEYSYDPTIVELNRILVKLMDKYNVDH